jgi:hypothetical protein
MIQPTFTRGGAEPLPSDPPDGVECPCGCGVRLRPFNGVRPLVCMRIWEMAHRVDRWTLYNGDADAIANAGLNLWEYAKMVARQRRGAR